MASSRRAQRDDIRDLGPVGGKQLAMTGQIVGPMSSETALAFGA
jgi:hypothetical protein